MDAARPKRGPQGRTLWILVAGLTAAGLAGVVVDFLGLFVAAGHGFGGGCALAGMGFLLILIGLVLVVIFVGLVGSVASLGLALLWRGSLWGPALLIASNLLSMAFYAWSPVYAGQVVWAGAVVVLAIAPAVAVVVLLPALVSRGRIRVRVLELVVLGLIAVPLVWLWVGGLAADVTAASTLPPHPQQTASAAC
jgi:hypothetical protein